MEGGAEGVDVVGAAGRGGEAMGGRGVGALEAGIGGRGGALSGGVAGRGGAMAGAAAGVAGLAVAVVRPAGLLARVGFLAEAAFLAVLRAAVFFFAVALRAVALRPVALRAAVRLAGLRAVLLRAPARFLAVDFLVFLAPSAAPALRIAAVAARFIFFKAVAAPELLFLLLDFAMIRSSCCLARHYGPNRRTTKHVRTH